MAQTYHPYTNEVGTKSIMSDIDTMGDDVLVFKVQDTDQGARLDKYLSEKTPDLSRNRLKNLVEDGKVDIIHSQTFRMGKSVERTITPATRLSAGMEIRLTLPAPKPAEPVAQDIPLRIIFEDEHLIIIDKPAGMVVHPAPGNPDGTLVNALLFHCGTSLKGIGGILRPGIVHRIDKDTSGLMVAAKDANTHEALSTLFASHAIERIYHAIVRGQLCPAAGIIETRIARHPRERKKRAVVKGEHGKYACTHYRTVTKSEGTSLLACQLETGRTHQIRVHMAHLGHPLIGDHVYGGRSASWLKKISDETAREAASNFPRQALHASLLGFQHPKTGEKMIFKQDFPDDFKSLAGNLRLDLKKC